MKHPIALKYLLVGVLFGLCFPIMAIGLQLIISASPLTLNAIIKAHHDNPLIIMIDSAPVFLGLFALFGGIKQERAIDLLKVNEGLMADQLRISAQLQEQASIQENHLHLLNKHNQDLSKGYNALYESLDRIVQIDSDVQNKSQDLSKIIEGIRAMSRLQNTQLEEAKTLHRNIHNQQSTVLDHSKSISHTIESLHTAILNIESSNAEVADKTKHVNSEVLKISKVSDEIKLLSLNASIESARAGESGRGFAIVANSIGNLANQTDALLKSIQEAQDQLNAQNQRLSTAITFILQVYDETQSQIAREQEDIDTMLISIKALEHYFKTMEASTLSYTESYQLMQGTISGSVQLINKLSDNLDTLNSLLTSQKEADEQFLQAYK